MDYVLKNSPSRHIDYASELNEEQYAAVTAPPGPVLIIAGAGSGKTRTLTYRVAYLIENGVEPENILLATFTNKAAKEMLERLTHLLPHDISRIWGGTFHSLCNRLLRRHADSLGYGLDFTILDSDDTTELAKACYPEVGIDPKNKDFPKPEMALEIISLAANKDLPLKQLLELQYPWLSEHADVLARIAERYRDRKRSCNVMDYDDLLQNMLQILQENESVRTRYQSYFQHLLVDEYQDTNTLQARFIDTLADSHKQLMVVGDDAQSIYSWRGANFANILTFPDRYPGTRTIFIRSNYRSTPQILTLANTAIAANTLQFPKELVATRGEDEGPKPALVCLGDANLQANFIAQRIGELIEEENVSPREIAILYRAHYHAMELQMELTRRQIPFQITSGLRFFEQAHVKDATAYLKLAMNPKDEVSFKRIAGMLPGVGEKTAAKLWAQFSSGTPLSQIPPPNKVGEAWKQWTQTQGQLAAEELKNQTSEQLRIVIEAVYEDYMKAKFTNFQNRLEDLNQLRAFSEQFESTEEFLTQLSLMTNADDAGGTGANRSSRSRREESDHCVRLSTIHQAKGLEWKIVFVIMLCDGLFPSSRAIETLEGEEEERRLFYVAVTRARDELYLTHPMIRASAGYRDSLQNPSRFLLEIPRDQVNEWKIRRASFHS